MLRIKVRLNKVGKTTKRGKRVHVQGVSNRRGKKFEGKNRRTKNDITAR